MGESKKARKKRKKKKKKTLKRRDPFALIASMRQGAGSHGQGRPDKEESKIECRRKVDIDEHTDE